MSQSKIRSSLSWLGVGVVIAGCVATTLVQGDSGAFAQTPSVTHVQTTVCRGAASGQVATSSRGQAQGWGAAALNTLCNGAEDSAEPASCFSHTMTSNSVSWARSSTTWQPNNALRLCAGALDAGRRLNCFTMRIGGGTDWSAAIDQCIAEERTLNVQIQPSAPAARVTAPLPQGEMTDAQRTALRQAAASATAEMTCRAPLFIIGEATNNNNTREGFGLQLFFRPATARNAIQPGQCWREGGWGNGALINSAAGGYIAYQLASGPCPLITHLTMRNGALESLRTMDQHGVLLLGLGRANGGDFTFGTRYGGQDTSGTQPATLYFAQRPENTVPPQCRNT
jgi:hypothetical protein